LIFSVYTVNNFCKFPGHVGLHSCDNLILASLIIVLNAEVGGFVSLWGLTKDDKTDICIIPSKFAALKSIILSKSQDSSYINNIKKSNQCWEVSVKNYLCNTDCNSGLIYLKKPHDMILYSCNMQEENHGLNLAYQHNSFYYVNDFSWFTLHQNITLLVLHSHFILTDSVMLYFV
jgi:hypothetical protein